MIEHTVFTVYCQTFNVNICVNRIMSQIKLPVAVMALHFEGPVSQQRRNFVLPTEAGK